MDISATSRQAKELGNWLWSVLTPKKTKTTKAFTMQSHRPFLGSVPDLSAITVDESVTITPRVHLSPGKQNTGELAGWLQTVLDA